MYPILIDDPYRTVPSLDFDWYSIQNMMNVMMKTRVAVAGDGGYNNVVLVLF